MSIKFVFLADRVDAVPVLARWYYDEWGHLRPDNSLERTRARVRRYLNRDRIPFILLATSDDEVVAAAQLKLREMAEIFPDKKYWLGGVYVAPGHRGRGYGSIIAEQVAAMAPGYGVRTLYLQTPALDGGLYARLGWTPCARATNRGLDVLVMQREL